MYNRKTLSDIMPGDVIYITLLRQPLSQLVSWLHYNGYYGVVNPVEMYENLDPKRKYDLWNSWIQMGITRDINKQEFISQINQLEKEFNLVMITEQFDISLLLLRRKLCWDISDMIYIPMKKANYTYSNNSHLTKMRHNETVNSKYKTLNTNAYSLYGHFKGILSENISKAEQDLKEELTFFQELKQRVSSYCSKYIDIIDKNSGQISDVLNTTDVLDIPASKWGRNYVLGPIDCAMMKFHKRTFQGISMAKSFVQNSNIDKYAEQVKTVKNEDARDFYLSFQNPVHPKYGIPLSAYKHKLAYDLDKDEITYKDLIRYKKSKHKGLRHPKSG